ncbi:conserved hypothetical protein [Ricinus communis]|uniref:F-box associated domain-containing protein n=1 Tax=Ricinus communis TaxID=3988 RepID=B9RSI7_RICCO|nr:conserved hypothetical protein [Ricinus communis]|eukprot:XP_002516706.1 uncharacterized protein LOC8261158 [Ricinus communis]
MDDKLTVVCDMPIPFLGCLCRFPKIIGSSNGLPCLDISPYYASGFVLWNFTIKQFRFLARPTISDGIKSFWMVATRFGFNQQTNDYKLVRIVSFCCNQANDDGDAGDAIDIGAELYSWSSASWRVLDSTMIEETIGKTKILDAGSGICTKPLQFKDALGLTFYPTLNVYRGYGRQSNRIDLWVFEDYGYGDGDVMGIPICVHNDSELILKRVAGNQINLAFLNFSGQSIKSLTICSSEFTCQFYSYVESLVLVSTSGKEGEQVAMAKKAQEE